MALQQATRKPTTPGDVLQYEYLEPLNLKIADLADMLNKIRKNKVLFVVVFMRPKDGLNLTDKTPTI